MAKKSKRQNTRLVQHRQQGKVLKPPLRTLPLQRVQWLRDVFPDMLWLCSLISIDNLRGLLIASRIIDIIDGVLDAVAPCGDTRRPENLIVDGSLLSLEGVPSETRLAVLDALQEQEIYEYGFPREFAHALGMYPSAPGSWLIRPWQDRGLSIDWEIAQRFLDRVINDCRSGQDLVPTRAKFLWLRGLVKAGRVSIPLKSDIPDLFSRYPTQITEEERRYTEPTIRAIFGSIVQTLDESSRTARVSWAQQFWRSNWHKYPCTLPESPGFGADSDALRATREQFYERARALQQRFLDVAQITDPDLHSPDRYEVLTGIVGFALRSVYAASRTPTLWSGEHGSPMLRSVVEALILLRWLVRHDQPEIYERFKDYSRGHLKLQKLHLEEYLDSLDNPPQGLEEHCEYLDALVNQDIWEEFQEIRLQGTFSGIDVRKMAIEVGMELEYKLLFAPLSSTAHGEWAALDQYALLRCANPLHRWHRVPRSELNTSIDPGIIESALGLAATLFDEYSAAVSSRPYTSALSLPTSGNEPPAGAQNQAGAT